MSKKSLPLFPSMQCDVGCGDCCGPAPLTEAEFTLIKDYVVANKIEVLDQGITCPLYLDGKCSVYPVRPFACQAFGHTKQLACSRGYNTNVSQKIIEQGMAKRGPTTRLTHEVLILKNPLLTIDGIMAKVFQTLDPNNTRSA